MFGMWFSHFVCLCSDVLMSFKIYVFSFNFRSFIVELVFFFFLMVVILHRIKGCHLRILFLTARLLRILVLSALHKLCCTVLLVFIANEVTHYDLFYYLLLLFQRDSLWLQDVVYKLLVGRFHKIFLLYFPSSAAKLWWTSSLWKKSEWSSLIINSNDPTKAVKMIPSIVN